MEENKSNNKSSDSAFCESKSGLVKFAFWLLIALCVFSIFDTFRANFLKFEIRAPYTALEPVIANVSLKNANPSSNILVCYNDYCKPAIREMLNNVYTSRLDNTDNAFFETPVKNIFIASSDKNFKNNIEVIDLHVGPKDYYFSDNDAKNLSEKSFSINLDDGSVQNVTALKIPDINNYRGKINNIALCILSLFYNWKYFALSYFWLFAAFVLFVFNKKQFNFKAVSCPDILLLCIIFALGIFLRAQSLLYFPLYGDEIYTKGVALQSILSCFQDPGNPPLFFILEYAFTKIFSLNLFTLRFLPLVFGAMFPLGVYLVFKNYSKNLAIFGAFLASINILNIAQSAEARGYSLCMLLVVVSVYFFFEYLKNPNNKNLIINIILNALMINVHYYLCLFVFTNFVAASLKFLKEKKTKDFLKYFALNFLAGLTFLPYLIISSKRAMSDNFNVWIKNIVAGIIPRTVEFYFTNKFILLIFAFLCAAAIVFFCLSCAQKTGDIKKPDENGDENHGAPLNVTYPVAQEYTQSDAKRDLFIYLNYSIITITSIVWLITSLYKPIFHHKIFLSIYPLLLLVEIMLIRLPFDADYFRRFLSPRDLCLKVFYSMLVFLLIFSFTKPMVKHTLTFASLMNFIKNDAPRYSAEYEIHGIVTDYKDYIKAYPEVAKLDYIKWHVIDKNNGEYFNDLKNSDLGINERKTIVYLTTIGLLKTVGNDLVLKYVKNPDAYVYKANAAPPVKLWYK